MLRLNYHPRLKFPANEATPEGKMSCRRMWGWLPHGRIYLGGTPILFGMAADGLQALERMEKAVMEINHDNRWDQRLFFEPDTGKGTLGTLLHDRAGHVVCVPSPAGLSLGPAGRMAEPCTQPAG